MHHTVHAPAFTCNQFAYPRGMARPSWPEWLIKYQDGVHKTQIHKQLQSTIPVLAGPNVVQLHWLRPMPYHYAISATWSGCKLQKDATKTICIRI